MGNLRFELVNLVTLELHNLFTILANDVIMMRMFRVVWIVKLGILAKVHLPNQPALRQQR